MERKALEGLRVIDLGRFAAGPWGATLLAEMGAEVIRIDRPGGEDDRNLGLTAPDGQGMTFHICGINKKGITLDIRTEKGKEILNKLIKVSDFLFENYSPGGAEVVGISYDSVKAVKNDIIYVSISGFGSTGPYAKRLAFDPVGKAMSGSMSITGFPGSPPLRDGSPWADFITAVYAAVGALTALHHREKTGEGQMVEVSLVDAALATACRVFMDYMMKGVVRTQMGNQSLLASQNVFQTKDGWMLIATIQTMWKRFCRLIEREDLIDDPRFNTDELRFHNRDILDPIIHEWVRARTNEELTQVFEKARIPFGPVFDGPQVAGDPHFRAREMIVELDYPGGVLPGEKLAVPGVPIKLSQTPGKVETPAPMLGEHNEEIYCDLLGYTRQELSSLREAQII